MDLLKGRSICLRTYPFFVRALDEAICRGVRVNAIVLQVASAEAQTFIEDGNAFASGGELVQSASFG